MYEMSITKGVSLSLLMHLCNMYTFYMQIIEQCSSLTHWAFSLIMKQLEEPWILSTFKGDNRICLCRQSPGKLASGLKRFLLFTSKVP